MANDVNIVVVIGTIFDIVIQRLGFSNIFIIVCTDSFLLYECFVKLGIIKKKTYDRHYGDSTSLRTKGCFRDSMN
jgi:hypothetical protein